MPRAPQPAVSITHVVVVLVAVTGGVVYAFHAFAMPASLGLLTSCSVMLGILPVTSERVRLALSIGLVLLGLGLVWAAVDVTPDKPARLLRDLGWTQALLGLWQSYIHASALVPRARAEHTYGPEAMARWRTGDMRFGLDLASRVVVRAQPSWAALVLETAWPEPRPQVVVDLLAAGSGASLAELEGLLGKLTDKGGPGRSEARWELARLACQVAFEAKSRPPAEMGGPAASQLVLAAAKVALEHEGEDERVAQIFSALVVPAVANPER